MSGTFPFLVYLYPRLERLFVFCRRRTWHAVQYCRVHRILPVEELCLSRLETSALGELHSKSVSIALLVQTDGSDKLLEESAAAGDLTWMITSLLTVEGELWDDTRRHGYEKSLVIIH